MKDTAPEPVMHMFDPTLRLILLMPQYPLEIRQWAVLIQYSHDAPDAPP